jgi:preprotein translocase subunit SecA
MNRDNLPDDVPIEAKMVTKAIRSAQTQVEQQNFEVRKNVLKYDEVMNQQRKVIYAERRTILEGEDHREQVLRMIDDVVGAYVDGATGEGYVEDWDLEQLWTAIKTLYPIELDYKELVEENEFGERKEIGSEELRDLLVADAHAAYEKREKDIEAVAGEGAMRQLERTILLSVLDRKWRDHLYEMDYLREGIHLRSMAQRDPVVEYQREGFDMFTGMLEGLKEESIGFLFNVSVETTPAQPAAASAPAVAAPAAPAAPAPLPTEQPAPPRPAAPAALRAKGIDDSADTGLTYSGPSETGGTAVRRTGSGGSNGQSGSNGQGTGTRKERRAAARAGTKTGGPKPAKSRKKR